MRKIQFSRGELIARSAAMGFALLLILAYFLLPMVNRLNMTFFSWSVAKRLMPVASSSKEIVRS